jgi:Flp pilus assembly protein CpaB
VKLSQRRLARPSIGGMLATRQGSLTLALLCAALAAGILMVALGRYRTGLHTTTKQATVLVATGEIRKGTPGQTIAAEKLYKSMPVVSSQLAVGAISNSSALAGVTAQADILPGQQLAASQFAAAAGVTGLLTPNQRAVAISIDEAHGATDILQGGDHVDVYSSFGVKSADGSTTDTVEILLDPNALVIKPASATPTTAGGKSITGSSLVLAIPSTKVSQVTFAADNGKLYLALRPSDASPTPSAPTTIDTVVAQDTYGGALAKAIALKLRSLLGAKPTTTTTGTNP